MEPISEQGLNVKATAQYFLDNMASIFQKLTNGGSSRANGANSWGYGSENGPHTWSRQFPLAAGSSQSPVHVESQRAVHSPELTVRPLTLRQPPMPGCLLSNTGVGFQVSAPADDGSVSMAESSVAGIDGGPLNWPHEFAQFHMHWGACDTAGSEHAMDGRLYPAELHLVHWCRARHANFDVAASAGSGAGDRLAVLAVFVEIGQANAELNKILTNFDRIKATDSPSFMLPTPVNLSGLMPSNTAEYFTYAGSLTTPPCYESVRWIVFRQPISISREQLRSLRTLDSNRGRVGCKTVDNYRHLMPLGTRQLLVSQRPQAANDKSP